MGPDMSDYYYWSQQPITMSRESSRASEVGSAVKSVLEALESLEEIEQKRVLKSAAILLGLA